MDTLQQQITALNTKVDSLYQLIDQLNGTVLEVVAECKPSSQTAGRSSMMGGRSSYSGQRGIDSVMEQHKDVLVDNNNLDNSSQQGERSLSPEIQIQRLTAQLTAAYNRIAALEEQLLAQRIH